MVKQVTTGFGTVNKKLPINTPKSVRDPSTVLFKGVGGSTSRSQGKTPGGRNERASEEDDISNMQLAKAALQDFGSSIGDLYKGNIN